MTLLEKELVLWVMLMTQVATVDKEIVDQSPGCLKEISSPIVDATSASCDTLT